MYNVDDGAPFRNVFTETKDHRLEMLPYKHERGSKPENVRTSPGTTVNEFISLPGLTEKLKFIHGNNGDFNPNKEDKYSSLLEETNPNLVKRGGILKNREGGIIKLQNAGSVPQVDNTKVSKPLMEYQKSTVEQDHDALVK
jgi:hypothetical protein